MAMKLIILLFLLHQFHAVASVILIGTPISTHPFGSKVKLTCVKEDGALVWTTSTGDILFNEEARYSKDEKYDNFKVDISGNQSSMIITNALFEDEGEYSCSDTNGKETILVKLEVAPRLIISYGGRKDPGPHLPSSSSPSISITCLAEGAKPEVSIRFKVGESDWLSPTNNEIAPNGLLFDTNATLNFQFIDDPNGNIVTCETSGQSSINPIAVTQQLMTPNCILEMNKIEATCNCTSNPPVYKYIVSTDGKMEVRKIINVEDLGDSTISCTGVNYIGVGTSKAIVLESTTGSSFPVYVIIIVCLVVVILGAAIVLVVYHRRKKSKSQNKQKQGDPSQNDHSVTEELLETADEGKKNSSGKSGEPPKGSTVEESKDNSTKTPVRHSSTSTDEGHTCPSIETSAVPPTVSTETTNRDRTFGLYGQNEKIDESTETDKNNSKDKHLTTPKDSTTGDNSKPSVLSSATKPVEAEVKDGNVRDMKIQLENEAAKVPPEQSQTDEVKRELAEVPKGVQSTTAKYENMKMSAKSDGTDQE